MTKLIAIYDLPKDVLDQIYTRANFNFLDGRLVCKGWNSAIQKAVQSFWQQLTTNLSEGPIVAKAIACQIQQGLGNQNPNYLLLFQRLHKHIKTQYGYSLAPCATFTDLRNFQKKIEDDSLWVIWPKIAEQLRRANPPVNIANPPQNAEEIRAFLNNEENAAILKTIGVLDLSDLGLKALPPEICKLTGLRKLNLNDNRLTALPASIGQLTQLTVLAKNRNVLSLRFLEMSYF